MAKLTLTIEVDDTQQSILNNDLVDINTWVQDAMTGKITIVGRGCNRSGQQS